MAAGPTLAYLNRLHRLVSEQADALEPTLDRVMRHSQTGSPVDRDFKTVAKSVRSEDRETLWSTIQLSCLHMAVSVADHTRGLALLLSQPTVGVPIYAHSTLARAAIETSANLTYLTDSGADFDLRFARGVAFLISDSDAARRAASAVPANSYMPAPGPQATRRHDGLLDAISRARIEIVPNRNNVPKGIRVAPGRPEAPIDVKMSTVVREKFPHLPGIYNLLSGVTHGMPHTLRQSAIVSGRRAVWDANPLDIGCSALAAVNAAHNVLTAHAWYRGLEGDPTIAASKRRIDLVDESMRQFAVRLNGVPRQINLQGLTSKD